MRNMTEAQMDALVRLARGGRFSWVTMAAFGRRGLVDMDSLTLTEVGRKVVEHLTRAAQLRAEYNRNRAAYAAQHAK